jgi:hypothetical protein
LILLDQKQSLFVLMLRKMLKGGRQDIVLGRKICCELSLIFDFKSGTVNWDNVQITRKKPGTLSLNTIHSIDPADKALRTFMKLAHA